MKIYYFSKNIKKTGNNGRWYSDFGNGQSEEYTSKEELIRKFSAALDENHYDPLTEEELTSIVCEDMPNYDFYAVQCMVDGFGHDTATVTAFKTYEECTTWITNHANEYKRLKIVGQFWGDEYFEYFG